MNTKAFAGAAGALWGFLLFAVTLLEAVRGRGRTLGVLNAVYPGYTVSYPGCVIGLLYGVVSGIVLGAAFCWLYTRFAKTAAPPAA